MKTSFRKCLLLFLGVGLFLIARQTKASHAQGADLTYVNVAPNTYVIQYKFYRDCSGITMGNTETITYRAPGCNATNRTITLQQVSKVIGTPFCQSVIPQCGGSTTDPPNFEEITYTGTLSLPSQCPNWIVSARIGNRNDSRNLVSGSTQWLFTDALINNVITQNNNSPRFGNVPVFYVVVNNQITINPNVTDLDGDSLTYSLVTALNDLNVPVTYGTYPAGISPTPFNTPYPAGTFSPTNPIISQTPVTIDAFTGMISFKPLAFVGNAAPVSQGQDKYVMAVQVDEYRKVNGVPTKIGHIKRDILITVVNPGINNLPALDSLIFRTVKYAPNTVLETGYGQPLQIFIPTSDANQQDVLRITSNAMAVIPASTFYTTGGMRPTGTFSWTPTQADVRPAPYTFSVTVRDNACPVPGMQIFNISLRVSANGPLGIDKVLPDGIFTAYPNPTSYNQVAFKIKPDFSVKNSEIVIWNVAGKVVDRIQVKAGAEQVRWNKRADLPAGIYFARLTSEAGTRTIKLVHLK